MVKTGGNQRQYLPGQEDPPSVAGLSAALSQRDRGALRDDRIGRKSFLLQV